MMIMAGFLIPSLLIVALIVSQVLKHLEKNQPEHKLVSLHNSLHWVYQVVPPLLLLFIFTTNGPGLWFTMSVVLFAGFISFISILGKLFKLKKNKKFFLRPILTISIAFLILIIANYSVNEAKEKTLEIAKDIEKTCQKNNRCPKTLSNWQELKADKRYKTKVGKYIKYPVFYNNLGNHFTLYFYQSLDLGTEYSSGVNGNLAISAR